MLKKVADMFCDSSSLVWSTYEPVKITNLRLNLGEDEDPIPVKNGYGDEYERISVYADGRVEAGSVNDNLITAISLKNSPSFDVVSVGSGKKIATIKAAKRMVEIMQTLEGETIERICIKTSCRVTIEMANNNPEN